MFIPQWVLKAALGVLFEFMQAIIQRVRDKDLLEHALTFAESHARALDAKYGINVDDAVKDQKYEALVALVVTDLRKRGLAMADGMLDWVVATAVQKIRRDAGAPGVTSVFKP